MPYKIHPNTGGLFMLFVLLMLLSFWLYWIVATYWTAQELRWRFFAPVHRTHWQTHGAPNVPRALRTECKTNVAGELGAVAIYHGLAYTLGATPSFRSFVHEHLQTEREHLHTARSFCGLLAQSTTTPLWWLMGFVAGLIAGLFGPASGYFLVTHVETFVVQHYGQQLQQWEHIKPTLSPEEQLQAQPYIDFITRAMHDEAHHRDDAHNHHQSLAVPFLARAWSTLVVRGSGAALTVIRWT